MFRILLPISATLAACTPSPVKDTMASSDPAFATTVHGSGNSNPQGDGLTAPTGTPNSVTGLRADSPAEARGRRVLSAAFVRVGPDGHLTVALLGGQVLVLRDVVMQATAYCGMQVVGPTARAKYCGGYAEVADARPGGAPASDQPDRTVEPAEGPAARE
jgi:hypothetical protein